MKKPQRFILAVVLALMLVSTAFAGDIWTPAPAPPPPGSPSITTPGDILTGASVARQDRTPASDSVEGMALNLLQILLSVF